MGVGLPSGSTCHGRPVAILLTTNTQYKEILALLLTAASAKQDVKFYQLGSLTSSYGDCVISEASLGSFPLW